MNLSNSTEILAQAEGMPSPLQIVAGIGVAAIYGVAGTHIVRERRRQRAAEAALNTPEAITERLEADEANFIRDAEQGAILDNMIWTLREQNASPSN